ncbi:MAG TPA: hypothetical protein VMU32_03485 [Solirubrobacteraceae bacterium]|nr:hypothetical protein [Solirubrobacteraceae bacterium]
MRSRVLPFAVLLPLTLASGCGESAQAKAEKQVCSGKQEVANGVHGLQSTTLATANASAVQSDIKAIESGIDKIKGAQGQLSATRRESVEKANAQLSSELGAIEHELSTLSLPQALTKLTQAGEKLEKSYKQAYASVPC